MPQPPEVPWAGSFVDADDPTRPATVRLRQVAPRRFALESSLTYVGPGPALPRAARTVRPQDLEVEGVAGLTDLASVPSALRWLVAPYGVHTPAALVHDRLVGPRRVAGVSDPDADRLFRVMLADLGLPRLRRGLMWAAVVFGTRWRHHGQRRAGMVVWTVLALVGMAALVAGLATGVWPVVVVSLLLPLPASLLWGRQYPAGLLASASAPWVLPPTAIGAAGFLVYRLLERLLAAVTPTGAPGDGREPRR